jgi:DNA modification methylase
MIINGNNIEELKKFDDNYFDSIVTDPPYEIGFMGKGWDASGIANNPEMWAECLRVLKPGGYLLSFSATRTYHRMASAIEDAGFEVRDMIEWVYGSGFPKSLNIGKAVDKLNGRFISERLKLAEHIKEKRNAKGITLKDVNDKFDGKLLAEHWESNNEGFVRVPRLKHWEELKPLLELNDEFDWLVERIERERQVVGNREVPSGHSFAGERYSDSENVKYKDTKGTSEWEGWGTALKPAHEPICMARKPLSEKTVAENVLKYGTGGINVDGSRVGTNEKLSVKAHDIPNGQFHYSFGATDWEVNKLGRFPANLIHDNSEEVRECFPETKSGKAVVGTGKGYAENASGIASTGIIASCFADSGNASRFFKSIIYQAKASKSERNKGCEGLEEKVRVRQGLAGEHKDTVSSNSHPTVKPVALMEYLIKMVTPTNGIVLDPFMGSGSTGVACVLNDFEFVGIDLDKDYCEIARARIEGVKETQTKMF